MRACPVFPYRLASSFFVFSLWCCAGSSWAQEQPSAAGGPAYIDLRDAGPLFPGVGKVEVDASLPWLVSVPFDAAAPSAPAPIALTSPPPAEPPVAVPASAAASEAIPEEARHSLPDSQPPAVETPVVPAQEQEAAAPEDEVFRPVQVQEIASPAEVVPEPVAPPMPMMPAMSSNTPETRAEAIQPLLVTPPRVELPAAASVETAPEEEAQPVPVSSLPESEAQEKVEIQKADMPETNEIVPENKSNAVAEESSVQKTRVEVAEAIRVPLSINGEAAAVTAQPEPASFSSAPAARRVLYYPSRSLHQSSFWLQIGYFADTDAAKRFWTELVQGQGALVNGLRFRIVRPYGGHQHAPSSVRLGPLRSDAQQAQLCRLAAARDLACFRVEDTGGSIAARYERRHRRLPADTEAAETVDAGLPQYWVQLGSYPHRDHAESMWSALHAAHPELLASYVHRVVEPHFSSALKPGYRLRAGPFSGRSQADALCESLRRRRVDCLAVRE